MNILELSHEYPPLMFGGIGSFVEVLSNELAQMGLNVHVLCAQLDQGGTIQPRPGLTVTRIPIPDIPPRNFWFQLRGWTALKRILRNTDVVHANTLSSVMNLANYAYKKPWLVTIHGLPIRSFQATVSRPFVPRNLQEDFGYVFGFPYTETLHRIDLQTASNLVFVAKHVMEDANNLYGSVFAPKSSWIWAPVSGLAHKQANHNSRASTTRAFTFGYFGRLYWFKGVLLLVDAFSRLINSNRSARLRIYGTGPLAGSLRDRINALRLRQVDLVGWIPHSELLGRLFTDVDAFVFPSIHEACPIALLEAMAMGKPVIVSDLPWGREFVSPGRTGLISKLDAEALAGHMHNLAADRSLCDSLGKNARAFVINNFTVKRIAAAYSDIFHRLC